MMNSFLLVLLVFFLGVTPVMAQEVASSEGSLVGTLDGYDVGGNHSICWTSQFPASIGNKETQDKNLLKMNAQLESNPNEFLFAKSPSCSQNGTSMTISRLDEPPSDLNVMWRGDKRNTSKVSAVFELDVEVDLDDFTNVDINEDTLLVWYRVFMCLAPQVGFCQPLLDSPEWESYEQPIVMPDDPMAVMPTVNSATISLDSVPTNVAHNITFRTDWVASRLERVGATRAFAGVIQLPTVCWKSMGDNSMYTVVGHATVEVPTSSGTGVTRIDVSSLFPGEPLLVATSPAVKEFGSGAIIFVGVLIGVAGLITVAMFCYILAHRNHRVMTMAQSGLMSALAAASFTTIVLSFLLMPLEDVFCRLQGLLYIPATFMPTILVGRLWRVYTTLSVAHSLGRHLPSISTSSGEDSGGSKLTSIRVQTRATLSKVSKKSEEWVMKLLALLACSQCIQRIERRRSTPSKRRSSNALRRTTSRTETMLLIFFLTLPQIVVQIFDVIEYWDYAVVWEQYSNDAINARKICRSRFWVKIFSATYLAAMFVLAMYVAWCSRTLPSAFNEKDAVFRAGFVSGVIVIIITVGLSYSDIPEVSPNLSVSFSVIMTVGVSLLTSWSVIMPKIRRVHGGETVVMTNILRDMNGRTSSSLSSEEEELRRTSQEAATRISTAGPETGTPRKRVTHTKTTLKHDEPIPKKMERQLYQLNTLAEAITDRCAEGRPMDKAEWELLQRLTADLHTEFDNVQMRFDDSPTSDSYSESMNQMNSSMNNNSSNWELERAKP